MLEYCPGYGFESDSVHFYFETICSLSANSSLRSLMVQFSKTTGAGMYTYLEPSVFPGFIYKNPGFKKLLARAYYDYLEPQKNLLQILIKTRWTTNCDSYKKLKDETCFLQQYDDEINGLTLVLYTISQYKELNGSIYFCFDFIEHDKIRLLRTLE